MTAFGAVCSFHPVCAICGACAHGIYLPFALAPGLKGFYDGLLSFFDHCTSEVSRQAPTSMRSSHAVTICMGQHRTGVCLHVAQPTIQPPACPLPTHVQGFINPKHNNLLVAADPSDLIAAMLAWQPPASNAIADAQAAAAGKVLVGEDVSQHM